MRSRPYPGGAPFWVPRESDVPPGLSGNALLPWVVAAAMAIAFAAGFAWLSVLRHEAFQSHAFDLGNMDQAVWNTLHGHLLRFTDMSVGNTVLTTRLAIHVEPLLPAFAPLYLLHSGPETLLVAQAVIVATGSIPAYLMGRAALGGSWLPLVFPLAYLLHPSLQNAVLDDFHPVTLSAAFLLWMLFFAHRRSMAAFTAFAVLAASTKEEVSLLVAMVGVAFLARRRWYAGFMCIVCGVGWFLVSTLLIIPAFNPSGRSPYLERYRYLGHGVGAIALSLIRHPGTVLHVLTSERRLDYLAALLHPLGFASLLDAPVFLLSLPALLINMLSEDPTMWSGFYQYSAEVVPYVIAAAVFGLAAASRAALDWRPRAYAWVLPILAALVVIASLVDTRKFGFSPLAAGYIVPAPGAHQRLEQRLIDTIPLRAAVAAADEVEPHLSNRYVAYLLPTVHPANGPAASYLVLDASIPALPVGPHTLHGVVANALRHGYGVTRAADGVLILRRGAARKTLPGSFYSFMFPHGGGEHRQTARWGPLQLASVTVHPKIGVVDRARPAVAVDSYWQVLAPLPRRLKITFYLSPVYQGKHPQFSTHWQQDTDSPTWDWLPIARWPRGRTVLAMSLPLIPDTYRFGSVDVAVGVSGGPPARGVARSRLVAGSNRIMRLATIQAGD